MSDRAIELFIRMHLEKTPSVLQRQYGRQTITGDVIIGAMGSIQHQQPIGCDLIMARWLDDTSAIHRIEQYLGKVAAQYNTVRPDILRQLADIALLIFIGKPTADQLRRLSSLWRDHSAQGHRSKRLVKRYQTNINVLQGQKFSATTAFREDQIDDDITHYEQLIQNEIARIGKWATEQSKTSYICPKCHGSGIIKLTCRACNGSGYFAPNSKNARNHLSKIGVQVSEKLWNSDLKPKFDEILSRLYQEHDETARLLGQRLREERMA